MIRAADGLEYESITAKLKNEPADTLRNKAIQRLREQGRSEAFVRTFADGWDAFLPDEAVDNGEVSGFLAAYEDWKQRRAEEVRRENARREAEHKRKTAEIRRQAQALFLDYQKATSWNDLVDSSLYAALIARNTPGPEPFRASGSPGNGPGSLRADFGDL